MSSLRSYEIRVEGHLGIGWSTWFEGLTIRHQGYNETVLTGTMDQAALHGALAKIRDLGLPLLSVVQNRQQEGDPQERKEK